MKNDMITEFSVIAVLTLLSDFNVTGFHCFDGFSGRSCNILLGLC